MGCCGSSSTYGIDPEKIGQTISDLRTKFGSDVLVMSIKDQNYPGKICMTGGDRELANAITQCLQSDDQNKSVVLESDKYDAMWQFVWRETHLTTGHSTFSLQKSYFPRGKIIVKLLDTIAKFGWGLAATPNFGGVESRDDKGNVTSCVDWPIFVFYKESPSLYTENHLLLAVKDSNIPGKLCAAGPVGELEGAMTQTLQAFTPDVKSEKDSYDEDYDVVWRNTSITTGMQALSFSKAYFPKGKTNVAMLACAYKFGWRAVAAPNFGGYGDSWPSIILRKLREPPQNAPELLLGAIKDSNIPGKFCFSGPSADQIVDALCGALTKVPDNQDVKSEKDSYDEDHDAVCRNVHVTTGMAAFSLKLPYFPRADSMATILNTWQAEGFQTVACPNFGGMLDSWPTFILEKQADVSPPMFLVVKDDNIPGKICLAGGELKSDASLAADLLSVLQALCGEKVQQTIDDYDKSFDLAFKHTIVTTGHATFTWSKPYWPHGYVVEMVLQVLFKKGYKLVGGPNFGDDGNQWPCMIFKKDAS